MPKRLLLADEKILLMTLLEKAPQGVKKINPDIVRVVDSGEAGARSIVFVDSTANESKVKKRSTRPCVEAEYLDSDGVLVMVTLFADQFGEVYEID